MKPATLFSINEALKRAIKMRDDNHPDYVEALEFVTSLPDYLDYCALQGVHFGEPAEMKIRRMAATLFLAGKLDGRGEAISH